MDKSQALEILKASIDKGLKKGAYGLEEISYIIEAIRVLEKTEENAN